MTDKFIRLGLCLGIGATLCGCSDISPVIFSTGGYAVTQSDYERYLYSSSGVDKAQSEVLNAMFEALYNTEWDEELEADVAEYWDELNSVDDMDSTMEYVNSLGYETLDEYKEDYIYPAVRQNIVIKHYILDNQEVYNTKYTPVRVKLVTLKTEKKARKFIKDLKDTSFDDLAANKDLEVTEVLLSTVNSDYPADLLSAVLANEEGTALTPVANSEGDGWYVFEVVSKGVDIADFADDIVEILGSDSTGKQNLIISLLEENGLEINDAEFLHYATFEENILVAEKETSE